VVGRLLDHPAGCRGTPPHLRRGEKRRTPSFALPSFLKEGWREAPGWLAVCSTTRGCRRHPSSSEEGRKTSNTFFRLPSFLKEGWREAPGWLAVCSTTPPAVAGTPPQLRREKNVEHLLSLSLLS